MNENEVKEQKQNKFINILDKVRKNVFFKILVLFIACMLITVVSFKYSVGKLGERMFESYFENIYIVILNFLPTFWLCMLVFAISNKVSISYLFASIVTYILTLANYFKMSLRDDNLLMEDLTLIREAMTIKTGYTFDISRGMIGFFVIFVAISIVMFFIFDKKKKVKDKVKIPINKKKVIARIVASVMIFILGIFSLNTIYIDPEIYQKTKNDEGGYFNVWSSINQYISRGTIYSFLYSYTAMKRVPPEGYNKKEAKAELEKYEYSNIPEDRKVNVIAIMLEAYSDLSDVEGLEFNVDPYRKWHLLESQSYSGDLITNIFAGGTVDSERKFLTGATNLPTLRKRTNSYVYYFKEQGYTVEGSHPSYDFFYNRLNINKNLGFDNYYFLENRYQKYLNADFIRDEILFDEIVKLYKENKSLNRPYFSFNVTYENHGPYPTEKVYNTEYVVKKDNYTDAEYNILNAYFWGINDTNNAIYDMIQELKKDEEPVVCILFGDHKPWLGNDGSVYAMLGMDMNWNTKEGAKNYYSTPYIIWANDKAKEVLNNNFIGSGEDISPNFLMNKFFELAGYNGNEYMKFTNEVLDKINVINTDFYYENGNFTKELTDENKKLLDKFNKIQYYQMNEFKK